MLSSGQAFTPPTHRRRSRVTARASSSRRRLLAVVLGVASSLGPWRAAAQGTDRPSADANGMTDAQRRERARKLAAEGFEALQQKNYAVAEDRFRRADALVHAPTLVVDHARALAGLGRLVEAHERYELVLREGVAPTAPWQWKLAYADAQRELEALKPRLAWLTLRVRGPKEPVVLVDGKPVPIAALGVRRATDPGTHAVSVSAPGFEPKEEIVSLDEGQTLALELTLDPLPVAPHAPAAAPRAPVSPEPPIEAEPQGRDKTLAYVLLGVGGLGIVAGAVTGGLALAAKSDLASRCSNGVCVPRSNRELGSYQKDIDEYHLWGTVSALSFAVGVAGAGAGATLLLLDGGDETVTGAVKAYVGVGTIGVQGRF